MGLDRNALARIDRRLLAELNGDGVQMVKVPVSDALWSVWRRYCNAVGPASRTGLLSRRYDRMVRPGASPPPGPPDSG